MATGVRDITVRRGLDPRDFPVVVAGGAGPLHAAAIAAELEVALLLVPRESSIFCAAGMLMCDFQHDAVRALKADPRVDQIERNGTELMVTLQDQTMHHGFLVERLVAEGIRVHSMAPHQLKLEDVFLRLTKGIVQ